ncbi:MAG: hypothetical protein L0H55_04410 [Candidatus Nitrosocosmicus sp.]|nr:hypothetical protein [Candidatus Nitrosocosmicus sp.]
MPSEAKNFLQDAVEKTDLETSEYIDSVKISVILRWYLYYLEILINLLTRGGIDNLAIFNDLDIFTNRNFAKE